MCIRLSLVTFINGYLTSYVSYYGCSLGGSVQFIGRFKLSVMGRAADFNKLIAVAEEKIHGKEIDLEMLEAEGNDEEYFDEVHEDDENNDSNRNLVKRGITRLYKFRMEYGKPDRIKLSVTIDALNRISRKNRALFSSF
nr:hypothetical protein [Tanacetum cinerariifolium]